MGLLEMLAAGQLGPARLAVRGELSLKEKVPFSKPFPLEETRQIRLEMPRASGCAPMLGWSPDPGLFRPAWLLLLACSP